MLPVRGATGKFGETMDAAEFQSMLPVRGATLLVDAEAGVQVISIHAPRAGSDTCSGSGSETHLTLPTTYEW